jgi:hypothetical protein
MGAVRAWQWENALWLLRVFGRELQSLPEKERGAQGNI